MKKIVLTERQENMLFNVLFESNRMLNYIYYSPKTRGYIDQSTKVDAERYRIETLNWKKGTPKPRPIINFFQPYVYTVYMMGHREMIVQPPTFRYSYFFTDFTFKVNGRSVRGLVRVSSKRASFDSFFNFSFLENKKFGFVDGNGIKNDFVISIVLPSEEETINEVGTNTIVDKKRRITIGEFVYNGEQSDDALMDFAKKLNAMLSSGGYKFGESLLNMECDVKSSDGGTNDFSMRVDGKAEMAKKNREHTVNFKLKQKLKASNSQSHKVETIKKRGVLKGIFFDGVELGENDYITVNRKIGEIDPKLDYVEYGDQCFSGEEVEQLKEIEIALPLPTEIIDGKKKAIPGKYQYRTNGRPKFTIVISKNNEGRVAIGNLKLVSKTLTPII